MRVSDGNKPKFCSSYKMACIKKIPIFLIFFLFFIDPTKKLLPVRLGRKKEQRKEDYGLTLCGIVKVCRRPHKEPKEKGEAGDFFVGSG